MLGDDVVDAVATLASHSLLVVDRSSRPRRYRILHVLREWLAERTPPDEAAAHRDGLLQWTTDLARDAGPNLRDFDAAPGWFARLDQEMPNLRAAVHHGLRDGSPLQAVRSLSALSAVWLRGEHSAHEAVDLLQQAVSRAVAAGVVTERELGVAYATLTELCFTSAQVDIGLASGRLAQQHARAAGDRPTLAAATGETAYMLVWSGDLAAAAVTAERAVELVDDLPDDIRSPAAEAMAWIACGIVEAARGDLTAAAPYLERARTAWERSNDWQATLGGIYFVERITVQLGDTAGAIAACADAARRCAPLEAGPLLVAHVLVLAVALGEDPRAAVLLAAAMAYARRVGFEMVFVDNMFATEAVDQVVGRAGEQTWARAVEQTRDWDRTALLAAVADAVA